jgi:hypothetical protein
MFEFVLQILLNETNVVLIPDYVRPCARNPFQFSQIHIMSKVKITILFTINSSLKTSVQFILTNTRVYIFSRSFKLVRYIEKKKFKYLI